MVTGIGGEVGMVPTVIHATNIGYFSVTVRNAIIVHVEQKNWSVIRMLIGYDRYNSRQALEALNRIYSIVSLYTNFFQPVMKLKHKTRHGAKVHKVYDRARTPYQRLLESGILSESKRQQMAATSERIPAEIRSFLEDFQSMEPRVQKAHLQTILKSAYVYRDNRIKLEFR